MTGFDFTENISFKMPDVSRDLSRFEESEFSRSHGLIVEIAALHEGTTQNLTTYEADELERSLSSWTDPYPRPIIINHDIHSDPLGRVMGARMAQESDGTPYMQIQAAIFNVDAAQKVSDRRFLTGSVGGKAKEAICSVCGSDWANPKEEMCKHNRGKTYKGKMASLIFRGVEWKEYSFVNAPSDRRSSIRNVVTESDLISAPKFFVFDFNKEDVMQLTESGESIDLFENMRKKEFQPMYLGLKGSYLSVMGVELSEHESPEAENSNVSDNQENFKQNINNPDTAYTMSNEVDLKSQENSMTKPVSHEVDGAQDDDVLAAIETLRKQKEESSVENSEVVETEEAAEAIEDSEEITEGEQAEKAEVEAVEADAENVDPEESSEDTTEIEATEEDAADTTDEVVEESDQVETEAVEADVEADSVEEEMQEQEAVEQAPEEELDETNDHVESPAEELKSRVEALESENAQLKMIVKRSLAEQVVDRKIELGIVSIDNRNDAVEEHAVRTAASLVDTMKDLDSMVPAESDPHTHPQVDEAIEGVDSAEAVITEGETVEEEQVDTVEVAENLFTDVLMGRKKL